MAKNTTQAQRAAGASDAAISASTSEEYKGSPRGERRRADRQGRKSSKSARPTRRNIERTALAIEHDYINRRKRNTPKKTYTVTITFFRDQWGWNTWSEDLTLDDLNQLIFNTHAPTKARLPYLKPAIFGELRTKPGRSFRHNANVLGVTGVALDYDDKKISFNTAVRKLRRARLKFLAYTSPSYTKKEPKWRLVLPTSRALMGTPAWCDETHKALISRVCGVFGADIFSGETWTLSQAYFYGRVDGKPEPLIMVQDVGDFIDRRDDLGAVEKRPAPQRAASLLGNPYAAYGQRISGVGFQAHLNRVGDDPGQEGFHVPLRAAVASYVSTYGANFDYDKLKARLRGVIGPDHNRKYLRDDRHLDALINSAIKKFGHRHVKF